MLKIKLEYDLPDYDPKVHDPDKVLCAFNLSWSQLCQVGIFKITRHEKMGCV